jgi:hypothetical protein
MANFSRIQATRRDCEAWDVTADGGKGFLAVVCPECFREIMLTKSFKLWSHNVEKGIRCPASGRLHPDRLELAKD